MADLTIEPVDMFGGCTEYGVFEHTEYPKDSVLAGQPRRQVLLMDDDLEYLKKQYPEAKVLDHSTRLDPVLPDEPPDWFDPLAAGEEW